MDKILKFIWDAINLFGRLNLDVEKTPEGKIKICIIFDPKDILK